jgi:hypothetical protein
LWRNNQPAGVPLSTQHYNLGLLLHTPPDAGEGSAAPNWGRGAWHGDGGGDDDDAPDNPPAPSGSGGAAQGAEGEFEPTTAELERACWHYEQSLNAEPSNASACYNWALVRSWLSKREALDKGLDAPDMDRTAEQLYTKARKLQEEGGGMILAACWCEDGERARSP